MRLHSYVVAAMVLAAPALAAAEDASPLPLKRVRLYETGVGYFERTGPMKGGKETALPVPAGHLDDALKTLVVLSKDGEASIDGLEFGSSVSRSMAVALAGLPAGQDGKMSYEHLLTSLKGAPVEIRMKGRKLAGRVVDVEEPPPNGERTCEQRRDADGKIAEVCTTTHQRTLLLLTGKSELHRLATSEITSIRPTDPARRARLSSVLDALSQRGAQSSRKLRVLGNAGKPITLGYIAETPVWRSTYRLVFANGTKPSTLQGWALLHNDTDEDWKKVRIELVNGRPDSFLFPLAAPRYARRELVTPQRELSTVPQLLDKTVDNMWEVADSYGAGGLGLSGIGEGGGGRGEGIGLGSIGTIGHGAGTGVGGGVGQSALLAVGNLASLAEATGVETGALFQYALKRPIDLRAHGSALLPYLNASVSVSQIAFIESPGATARSGAHLKNSTKQTLPAGPISVFSAGGFAGETALSRTKPGEQRILQFGFDLDVELEMPGHDTTDEPRILLYDRGTLTEHFMRHHTVTYNVINRSGAARKVYFPLTDYVSNASVEGVDGLVYDPEKSQPIAALDIAAGKTMRRIVKVREGLSRSRDIADVTLSELQKLAKTRSLHAEQRAIVRKAVDQAETVRKLRAKAQRRNKTLKEARQDLKRLRSSLRALRSSDDAREEIADKLVVADAKVEALVKELRKINQDVLAHLRNKRVVLSGLNAAAKKLSKATGKAKSSS